MTDKQILELLPDFVTGKCTPEKSDAIKKAATRTPSIQKEIEFWEEYFTTISSCDQFKPSDNFLNSLNERLDNRSLFEKFNAFTKFCFRNTPYRVAGITLSALLLFVFFYPEHQRKFETINTPVHSVQSAPAELLSEDLSNKNEKSKKSNTREPSSPPNVIVPSAAKEESRSLDNLNTPSTSKALTFKEQQSPPQSRVKDNYIASPELTEPKAEPPTSIVPTSKENSDGFGRTNLLTKRAATKRKSYANAEADAGILSSSESGTLLFSSAKRGNFAQDIDSIALFFESISARIVRKETNATNGATRIWVVPPESSHPIDIESIRINFSKQYRITDLSENLDTTILLFELRE